MAELAPAQFSDIDELFGADLDDIADLASFETPPTGAYILKVSTEVKDINKKKAVEAQFELVETVELKNGDINDKDYIPPSKEGTKFSTAFILGTSVAEGYLKRFLAPFGEHYGTKNVGELVRDKIKEVQIAAVVSRVPDKDDPEKFYARVSKISVV